MSILAASSDSEREALVERSEDVEKIYSRAALRGGTVPPPAQDEVDLHYICFIKSVDGLVYEMDSDASGPLKTNVILNRNQDMLEPPALECVRSCIARNKEDIQFSLLALVHNTSYAY